MLIPYSMFSALRNYKFSKIIIEIKDYIEDWTFLCFRLFYLKLVIFLKHQISSRCYLIVDISDNNLRSIAIRLEIKLKLKVVLGENYIASRC